jgi:PAS domain-containing protein
MPDKSPEVTLARLTAIIEHSDDAILSKTADGLILSWNPSASSAIWPPKFWASRPQF